MAEITIDFPLAHKEFDNEEVQNRELTRQTNLTGFWRFYDGEHRKWLKVKGDVDDNVIINLCSVLVDRSVSRLFGDPMRGDLLKFNVEQKEDVKARTANRGENSKLVPITDQAKANSFLNEVWERSGGLDKIYNSTGVFGAVTGHFIFKMMLDQDGPRVVTVDPSIFGVLTRADDKDRVKAYKIEFIILARDTKDGNVKETQFRQLIVHGPDYEGPEGWFIQDFNKFDMTVDPSPTALEDTPVDAEWIPVTEMERWDFAPIIDGQNLPHARSYWGQSDMQNVTGINDEINFVMSNVNRIIRFHAHPRTIGIGLEAASVQDTAIESFWTIASTPDKVKIQNLEMESDLPAVFNFFAIMREAFWTIGREADPSVFKEKIGNVTNFGLRVLFLDALNKLGQKRQTYGRAFTLLIEKLLELGDFNGLTAVPVWHDPLPADPRETVETLVMEREIGIVSKETAARERGRDWDQESARIEQEPEIDTVGQNMMKIMQGGGSDKTGRGNVSRT